MTLIGGVGFIVGGVFTLLGAWPVLLFFGVIHLLIFLAFKSNYRAGQQSEIVEIRNDELQVRLISPGGQEVKHGFQAYWSRLDMSGGRLLVFCKSDCLEIGKFLIEEEKEQVKDAITSALYQYRNGVAV